MILKFYIMSKTGILKSSVAKKYWMAATGLFLCLFLVGHLMGNLQLFIPGEEGKLAFNEYSIFMTTNPAVRLLSYLTYFSIIFHAIDGLVLTINNQKARPVKYSYNRPDRNSTWSSRNMGILGTIILVFIIVHMANFWYRYHFGELATDSAGNRDLHGAVMFLFTDSTIGLWYTIGYVLSMAAVGFHLVHGVQAATNSLGARTNRLKKFFQKIALIFAILVPALFAAIPVYIYLTH